MKLAVKLGIATASITLSFAAIGATAQAAFVGSYDPSNWTFTNTNANGSVNNSGAPAQIQLTGGNNLSSTPGATSYTTTAATPGQLSFSWNYSTPDYSSSLDPFVFVLNGNTTDILNNVQETGQGNFTSYLSQGDVFGFRLETLDNLGGGGSATISNFNVATVPEPSEISGSFVSLGIGWLLKRKLEGKKK